MSGCSYVVVDCADTGILRTPSRRELLYTRSQIVIAAKAFGLDAIDMVRSHITVSLVVHINKLSGRPQVCVQYKDLRVLEDECLDGRQLGFTGKVRILCTARHSWTKLG